jgi:RNA polymerase sigma-70 factor, ECF subfamily
MMALPKTLDLAIEDGRLDLSGIYEAHSDFVWRTLQRLGVRESDLEDVLQEVFVVVHRRLNTFNGTSEMSTWLFGIALRVAAAYRRRAHRRFEEPVESVPLPAGDARPDPEQLAADRQARERLAGILERMDLEKRAAFVMFEIEGISCPEIARITGVPVGTVYSRLSAARHEFEAAVRRLNIGARRGERP